MNNDARIMKLIEVTLDSNCFPDEACREHPNMALHLHNWLEAQILRREAAAAIAAGSVTGP